MRVQSPKKLILSALLVFVALPLFVFYVVELPARTVLKNTLSMLTILAFSLMLQQFFLTRNYKSISNHYRLSQISKLHKYMGYGIVTVFLFHPFLLVVPRFFEAGVDPLDALITIFTNFDSLGIVLGLIAWGLMFLLGVTAFFRYKLVRKLGINYKAWRLFHGILSVIFVAIATWHAIDLGRHTDNLMAGFMILLAVTGSVLLARQYLFAGKISTGAKS